MAVVTGDELTVVVSGDYGASGEIVQSYQMKVIAGGAATNSLCLDDLVEWFEALWPLMRGLYHTVMQVKRIRVRHRATGEIVGERTFSPALLGTSTAPVSALTQTAPVTFATKYPNIRLRKSLGPISESMVLDSGALEAAAQTILANTGAFLIVPYAATNLTYEYGYYSPVKLEWLIPTGYSYTNAPGTMVTRRLGRGS